jgi:hypothetical protein
VNKLEPPEPGPVAESAGIEGNKGFNRTNWVCLSAILLLGVLLRISAVYYVRSQGFFDHRTPNIDGWGNIADNLFQHREYLNEGYQITAERGPIYPYFLYGVYRVFGQKRTLALCFQAVFDVGVGIFIFLISQKLFASKVLSLSASLAWSLYFPEYYLVRRFYSEPMFTFLQAVYVYVQIKGFERPSPRLFMWAGFWLGITTLCRPVTQFFPLFVLAGLTVSFRRQYRLIIQLFAPFLLAFSLTLAPWIIRNYRHFGAFVPGSTLLGYNLLLNSISLQQNDYRTASLGPKDVYKYIEGHPALAKRVERANEAEADLIMGREAVTLIGQYPVKYLETCTVRFKRLWFSLGFAEAPQVKTYLLAVFHAALLVLSVFTAFFCKGDWRKPALPVVLLIIYTNLAYIPVHAVTRMLIPVVPYLLILAGYAVVSMVGKSSSKEQSVKIISS